MVEALQRKESYGGGVSQRAVHLANHLRSTDPMLSDWLDRQARAAAAGGGSGTGGSAAGAPTASVKGAAAKLAAAAAADEAALPAAPAAAAAGGAAAEAAGSDGSGSGSGAEGGSAGAAAGTAGDAEAGGGKGEKRTAAERAKSSKGGAATALEYLTTTFAHLREQKTLVGGDKKDRLLKEVSGLRALRSGSINVLRGATAAATTMADMLAALKRADADGGGAAGAAGDGKAQCRRTAEAGKAAATGKAADGAARLRGELDNLTCVVVEDWRGEGGDGPEDTRLAMRLSTFVALALCSQRLIAELYQDMFITPQRAAALRPQRKRQRTAAEETVQTLDESPDSLDFVDFVEALHRRMPLRCGWMYANAIMPTAGEWDRVFGRQAGRLSGLYEGGPELDALGRAVLAFHHDRHESPILDVYELATRLRQQHAAAAAAATPAAAAPATINTPERAAATAALAGSATSSVILTTATADAGTATSCEPARPDGSCDSGSGAGADAATTASDPCAASSGAQPAAVLVEAHCCASPTTAAAGVVTHGSATPAAKASGLILARPGDSSGRSCGLDLGHLSCCCVAAAPLSDDFLGELLRQSTVGQAAEEVAATAAAAAAVKASKSCAGGPGGGGGVAGCLGGAVSAGGLASGATAPLTFDAAVAAAVEEEEELCAALQEELAAVAEASEAAEREGEAAAEAAAAAANAAAAPEARGSPSGPDGDANTTYLRGAYSHRLQLLPGVFFNYYIGSQAFTNTAWHVEDFLLQSINLMLVGRPKAWWWVPRDAEAAFKDYLEDQWEKEDVYTKSVPLASVSLERLVKLGVRRSVQLPGSIFLTSPGYAFHTTLSSGWSMADSANFMANIVGKDMHVLEDERPLEQYPPSEGRTCTGEWVRFNMRRIEQLRARNDPSYAPRQLTRVRAEAAARRTAAAAAAAEAAVKKEEREEEEVGPVGARAKAAGGGGSGAAGRGHQGDGETRPSKQQRTLGGACGSSKAAAPKSGDAKGRERDKEKKQNEQKGQHQHHKAQPAAAAAGKVAKATTAPAAAAPSASHLVTEPPSQRDLSQDIPTLGRQRHRKRKFDDDFIFDLPKPSNRRKPPAARSPSLPSGDGEPAPPAPSVPTAAAAEELPPPAREGAPAAPVVMVVKAEVEAAVVAPGAVAAGAVTGAAGAVAPAGPAIALEVQRHVAVA
ncbi:hypothetical protein GPECTOR_9g652 [Gonium pectorale]|uniref:JmjC domain-containing protein n=1 Tax=Gonium pectorale TaxID=33097 RepID=A0A150GRZ1_GONPE|nr:hypothetical protein GPECTOR_9g652 [Gonium pectorale]|eukprot:KXZ52607.1 hypothetical protein GPECTOR_9g652 [Gonium pectorale]